MATAKKQVHPYVALDHKGKFQHIGVQAWPTEDHVSDTYLYIGIPPVEIDVSYPDDDKLRLGAAAMIAGEMEKARAAFTQKMTALQVIHNGLLCLEAPEVLDKTDLRGAGAKPIGVPGEFGEGSDDDIPF